MPQYETALDKSAPILEERMPYTGGSVTESGQVLDHPSPLPEGYDFAGIGSIGPTEVAKLYRSVTIGRNVTDESVVDHFKRYQEEGIESVEVGVRRVTDGRLVGYGVLLCSDEVGILDDLAVSPDDQHQGIGKAIIDQRLTQADALNMKELYTSIEPTNTLKPYYLVRGFQQLENGAWVREPSR